MAITFKENVEEATSTFNEGQRLAFEKLRDFLENEENEKEYFVLEGVAGVGKTYLISKLVSCIDAPVAMTAPTNKAVKVLAENPITEGRVDYSTIHQLLALTVKWWYPDPKNPADANKEPKQILVRNPRKEVLINNYQLIIVDEVSMLDDELLEMIKTWKNEDVKVIFMGDPAQIPPVNRYDSIPLITEKRMEWDMDYFQLTEIMRQKADNKILETAHQIRYNRFGKTDPLLSRKTNENVMFYSSLLSKEQKIFLERLLKDFDSPEFNKDVNYVKVIAYTNKTVNRMNDIIRAHIYREYLAKNAYLPSIMVGEKIIADKPIIDWSGNIIFNTSDEFTVDSYEMADFTYVIPNPKFVPDQIEINLEFESAASKDVKGKSYTLHYYDCVVSSNGGGGANVKILHENSENPYVWALSKLKKQKDWREYTKLQEKFANIKYNYAITAHKSQGSTYGKVYLIEDDMDVNKKDLERNRIKYTACTRPKYELHILSKRNYDSNILGGI